MGKFTQHHQAPGARPGELAGLKGRPLLNPIRIGPAALLELLAGYCTARNGPRIQAAIGRQIPAWAGSNIPVGTIAARLT